MYLKPADGLIIPDPARGDALPPEGREVEHSQYWQRRLNDRDVVESTPPAPAATTPNSKKEA